MIDWDIIIKNAVILWVDMAKHLWPVFRPYIVAGVVGYIVILFIKRSIHVLVYASSATNREARTREKKIFALVDLIDCLRGISSKAK